METVSANVELVAVLKLVSPEYIAVIECVPPVRVDTTRFAAPEVRLTMPRLVAPSKKFTLPVGVPADDDTAAVSVSDV